MYLLLGIGLMILIGWVAIKFLKVFAWIVGVLLVANLLSLPLGIVVTVAIIVYLLLSHKKITEGIVIFIILAFLFGLVF